MIPQRARVAESRVKHRLSNGPRRVQSNETETTKIIAGIRDRVFCNVWAYVSCRGYVGILQRAQFKKL